MAPKCQTEHWTGLATFLLVIILCPWQFKKKTVFLSPLPCDPPENPTTYISLFGNYLFGSFEDFLSQNSLSHFDNYLPWLYFTLHQSAVSSVFLRTPPKTIALPGDWTHNPCVADQQHNHSAIRQHKSKWRKRLHIRLTRQKENYQIQKILRFKNRYFWIS